MRTGVGRLQVVDELRQVLDGVDVVVRRRRDEAHARRRVARALRRARVHVSRSHHGTRLPVWLREAGCAGCVLARLWQQQPTSPLLYPTQS